MPTDTAALPTPSPDPHPPRPAPNDRALAAIDLREAMAICGAHGVMVAAHRELPADHFAKVSAETVLDLLDAAEVLGALPVPAGDDGLPLWRRVRVTALALATLLPPAEFARVAPRLDGL